ncbi:hypothetical protein AKJ16_DCAP02398 [Drosera capensis]
MTIDVPDDTGVHCAPQSNITGEITGAVISLALSLSHLTYPGCLNTRFRKIRPIDGKAGFPVTDDDIDDVLPFFS